MPQCIPHISSNIKRLDLLPVTFWHNCLIHLPNTCADSDWRLRSLHYKKKINNETFIFCTDTHRKKGTLRSFMAWRAANSPCSSHHLLASDWNLLTSSGSTVVWENDRVLHTEKTRQEQVNTIHSSTSFYHKGKKLQLQPVRCRSLEKSSGATPLSASNAMLVSPPLGADMIQLV